jgi:hypothetical protein
MACLAQAWRFDEYAASVNHLESHPNYEGRARCELILALASMPAPYDAV